MDDIRAIMPTRFMTVLHLFDRRLPSRKKNIAAPIIATEINQKDPPTTSCGSNNLFMIPFLFFFWINLLFKLEFWHKSIQICLLFLYIVFKETKVTIIKIFKIPLLKIVFQFDSILARIFITLKFYFVKYLLSILCFNAF